MIWRQLEDALIVAIWDPDCMETTRLALAHLAPSVQFVLATRASILAHYESEHFPELSEAANTACPSEFSCRGWKGLESRRVGMAMIVAAAIITFNWPQHILTGLLVWILVALAANSGLKLTALLAFYSSKRSPDQHIHPRPKRLPKVSILVPLLREHDILDRLMLHMDALVYPRELLEICLVYEANDTMTQDYLKAQKLPKWMRIIEVPQSKIQTKPRAMNYALDFCKGDIIGIYDAEDAPEPDQIYKVVKTFEDQPDDVACVQCKLDYYNSDTNWISRCFTIEYAILFRVILPGLERLKMPIPLGGTSVFIKRDTLEQLGCWDAHNVTEDAELGMRLFQMGYRCASVDATTYEEANFRLIPWIRQRSRWLKGFMQTWIAHLRQPQLLIQRLGVSGFLVFNILFLGTFTAFAAAPLVLPLWAFTLGFDIAFYNGVPAPILDSLVFGFLFTEALLLILGFCALRQRGAKSLYAYLPAMWFYWPIGSLTAYKAFYELFTAPDYWDKTAHGINDRMYEQEINRLTRHDVSNDH